MVALATNGKGTNGTATPPPSEEMRLVAIADLVTDFGTQMRPENDLRREEMFAEIIAEGKVVDAIDVTVIPDGREVLTDGFHRAGGASRAEASHLWAIVRHGTEADAMRAAAQANIKGTLPRCDRTKRNAVLTIIDLDGPNRSAVHYAEQAGVSETFARKVLAEHIARNPEQAPATVKGRDGRDYKRRSKPEPAPEPDDSSRNGVEVLGHDPDPRTATPRGEESTPEPDRDRDAEFLDSLYRGTDKQRTRDMLAPKNRAIFDDDALRYRDLHDSAEWRNLMVRAERIYGEKKVGVGCDGNYARKWSWFRRTAHPRDWSLCGACKGTGKHVDGHKCSLKGCNGLGYLAD